MARDNDRHAVVTPLLGAGVLGTGAYGSYKLDKHMADLGVRSGLTLNENAVKAINEFANATPEQMRDPSRFIFRYADLGNKASKAQLFNEDPRKAYEWFGDKTIRKGLSKDFGKLERGMSRFRGGLNDFINNYVGKVIGAERASSLASLLADTKLRDIHSNLINSKHMFTDVGTKVNMKRLASSKLHEAMVAAHETEIGKSRPRALIRLMNEFADTTRLNARKFVTDTADALQNWRTAINPATGKKYRSAAEYIAALYENSEASMRPYMRFFKDLDKADSKLSRKELINILKKRLFPNTYVNDEALGTIRLKGKHPFAKEVLKSLGRTTRYRYDEELGKLAPDFKHGGYRRHPGVKGVESVRSIIRKSPILTFMAADLGQGYRGTEFGQMIKGLRIGQALRNPKLRLALGIGSAGLGGLGITNLVRNIRNKGDN